MKPFLATIAALALVAATPALAQTTAAALQARAAEISMQIDQAAQAGRLSPQQAEQLRSALAGIQTRQQSYSRLGGPSMLEGMDIQRRLDTLAASVAAASQTPTPAPQIRR